MCASCKQVTLITNEYHSSMLKTTLIITSLACFGKVHLHTDVHLFGAQKHLAKEIWFTGKINKPLYRDKKSNF